MRWLLGVASVVMCLALLAGVACGGGAGKEEGVKEVKLGVGLPLSGIYGAFIGIPVKQGLELAADYIGEFTVDGQRYKWNIIFEDSGIDSAGGVASATKLIFEDGVKLMTQIYTTPAMAAQTLCEESGVIVFSTFPLEALGPDNPYSFMGMVSPELPAATLMKYISEERPEVKTASAIGDDTSTTRQLIGCLKTAAEYNGIEWLEAEYVPSDTVEFYPVAAKMMTKDPDLCYIPHQAVGPMREMGWEGTSFYSLWGKSFGDQYGWGNFQGHLSYYPEPMGEELPEPIKEIAADYQQQFGAEFTLMSFHYVIQLCYLTDALKKAGTVDDVDQIVATLETGTFDTPIGTIWFGLGEMDDIGHLLITPCWIGEIRSEEYHRVFEVSANEAEALVLEIFAE